MIVNKIICDRCMSDITYIEHESAFGYDFCPECYQMIKEGFDAFMKKTFSIEADNDNEPENKVLKVKTEKTVEKTLKPKHDHGLKIDWDKACALKIAGWSNKAIAEELKINKPTVDSTIYKKVEEYKKGVRMNKVAEPKEEKEEKCPFD